MQKDRTRQLIERLRVYRDQADMQQNTLADLLELSPANLSEIMRGNNSPTAETALRIQELLESENMESTEPTLNPTAAPKTGRVVIGRRVVSARLAAFIEKRKLLKTKAPKAGKPAKLEVPQAAQESAPRFSQNALTFFNMAVSTLERTDIREGQRLLLAHHYLKSSGDPYIATINPIELLKEIKENANV